ncbi:hypothetical protein K0C01_08940 [Salinarchaeum sp. IM2453]|uniref:cupredoxin domain-containing protein n=1 Tax=Salinarchaeum sp. IM2453 TaxID=2862870 RepID=UPI001C838F1B|nr:plastocyanin/azurin family copper-binding protein [Salinarchaeum sp. IM2453]QZA87921.1 hypothetical protein K0C01_08940 [Salinarchaeum sp. IM2453]
MHSQNRRSVLATTGSLIGVSVAGCSSMLGDTSNQQPLSEIPGFSRAETFLESQFPGEYSTDDYRDSSDVEVQLELYSFDPELAVIEPDTTIHWRWPEYGSHDVVSIDHLSDNEYTGDFSTDFGFESDMLAANGQVRFDHTFIEPGVGLYVCTPHQEMAGAIVVTES